MTETLASHLVNGLARHGVDRVFAIPGVHNTELFRGLTESGIAVVLPRHEQSAGFMADGFARATGRPGVCFVVTGPGLTNVLTAFRGVVVGLRSRSRRLDRLVAAQCRQGTR